MTLRARTAVTIALAVIFNATGNLFLSLGMKRVGEIREWSLGGLAAMGRATASSGSIWIGLGMLTLFFVSYLLVLSWADYSYVLPASAAGYALVPMLGYLFAGEQVSPLRWSGVLLICFGVVIVGRTPVQTSAGSGRRATDAPGTGVPTNRFLLRGGRGI
jgi:drug/metabolite transporter (DMT)-like permease